MRPPTLQHGYGSERPRGTAGAVDRISPSAPSTCRRGGSDCPELRSRVLRAEFATGRSASRVRLWLALVASQPVSSGLRWDAPNGRRDLVGTICHSGQLCIALVGRAHNLLGIGIDVEEIEPMPLGLASMICCPDENDMSGICGPVDPTLLRFVAKEAFFKAYFPATRAFLDFQDVRVAIDGASGCFEAHLMEQSKPSLCGSRVFGGRFAMLIGYVVAGIWIGR